MQNWNPPKRPAAYTEEVLVTAILDGTYPPGSVLPAERELASQLGITRPTLREALRRLEADGWLTVQQGKSTQVRDFWREGGLNVLSSLVRYSDELPGNFIPNLLDVRLAMAPAYTRSAVEHAAADVAGYLSQVQALAETPQAFAAFDWKLHYTLTVASGNPIYTLILNGFSGFYEQMACLYFATHEARDFSLKFYLALLHAAQNADPEEAERVTRNVMEKSIELWRQTGQTR